MPESRSKSTELVETPGDDVVVTASGEVLPTPPPYLRGLRIITDFDDLAEASIERIMNATTPQDALPDPSGEGLRDLSGRIIVIESVVGIMPSTIPNSDSPYYLRFTARLDGREISLSTGSKYASAGIVKLHNEGWLPRRVLVVSLASKSDPGLSSLWVVDKGAVVEGQGDEQPF